MADSTLNITVTTSGVETIEQIRKNIRELAKDRDKTSTAELGQIGRYNSAIKEQRERVGELTAGAVTANGKMMKSYFTLGEELRRYYMSQRVGNRTMSEVTQTASRLGSVLGMGGLGSIVGTAAQGFEQMEFAVSAAGIATKRMGGSLGELGEKLLSMAGPLAGMAAGIALAGLAIGEMKSVTKGLDDAIKNLNDAMIASGGVSKQMQIDMLKAQDAMEKHGLAITSVMSLVSKKTLQEDLLTQVLNQATEAQKRKNKEQALENELNDKFFADAARDARLQMEERDAASAKREPALKAAKELAEYEKERVVWLQKYWDLMQKTGEQRIAEGFSKRWLGKEAKPEKVGMGYYGPNFKKGLFYQGDIDSTSPAEKIVEPMTEGISQAQMAVNTLTDSMQSGFQEATSYLAQGFQQAFGLGNSLLDRMIATFATSALTALPGMIANLMTAGATGNIFTALGAMIFDSGGVIQEPVAGVGMKSGRPYQIAWNGQPERISPINSVGQSGRYGGGMTIQPSVTVHPIESNAGLAVRVEIGNRTNSRKRL
jgi:hypothetical protein